MGAAVSVASVTNTQRAISTITNKAIQSVNSNCAQGIQSTQSIKVGEISGSNGNTFTNRVKVAANLICIQSTSASADFQNAITSSLKADLVAGATAGTGLGVSVAVSDIDSFSESISNVANSFELSTLQSCINTVLVDQGFEVTKGIYNSNNNTVLNDSTIDAVANCNQQADQLVAAQNSLATEMVTKGAAKAESGFNLGIIGIVIVVLLLIFFYFYKTVFGAATGIVKGTFKGVENIAGKTIDTAGNIVKAVV